MEAAMIVDEMKAEERRRKQELAREARKEIASRTITSITTALALVSALFWQTAITDTIKTFLPVSGAWEYEIVVALVVTTAAATTIYLLSRPIKEKEEGK
jgi:hypothetical protein